ncbi:MAG TPA: YidC/Oxa1 family membrane protein insertase [Actinomycetota bacterium]
MIALAVWQDLLKGLGWVLARLYDLVPSYAVAIIVLTVVIRLLLLPLGIKQIRSMQEMARLQPKVKAIQQKHRGNRAKLNEELQKLYREHNVNPLAGCLPMILQLPVLIALYSVLRFPLNVGGHLESVHVEPNSHIPVSSQLYDSILNERGDVQFLQCSAGQAGTGTQNLTGGKEGERLVGADGNLIEPLDCGSGVPIRIPYYLLAVFMVLTTYYQSRQMQRANPSGSQQQQALTRIMPLMFGVWGFLFPAGLVVYWTTSNLWQIGQQHFIIRAREHEEAEIAAGRKTPTTSAAPRRRGFMASMMERAEQAQKGRSGDSPSGSGAGKSAGTGRSGTRGSPGRAARPSTGGGGSKGGSGQPRGYKPAATSAGDGGALRRAPRGTKSPLGRAEDGTGDGEADVPQQKGQSGAGAKPRPTQSSARGSGRSSGSRNAGNRKKRRKR